MAITLKQIESFMIAAQLKYSLNGDYISTRFSTDLYKNQAGEHNLFVIIRVEEDGQFFKITAPSIYKYPLSGFNLANVLQILNGICWSTKMIRFEYDEVDGEIRASVDIPLEDSTLSFKQFMRCLNALIQLIDRYHPAIALAISGESSSLNIADEVATTAKNAENILKAAGVDKNNIIRSKKMLLED